MNKNNSSVGMNDPEEYYTCITEKQENITDADENLNES